MTKDNGQTSVSFLFWNINRNESNYALVGQAIDENNVDVCLLAEMVNDTEFKLEPFLPKDYMYHPLSTSTSKVKYFHGPRVSMKTIGEEDASRGSMVKIDLDSTDINSINLVGCHLIDPINNDEDERKDFATLFNQFIIGLEDKLRNFRTVVMGDFNMNPFQKGMTSPHAFNAVMCKNVARRGTRMSNNRKCRFFYNPMWYYFGHPDLINGTIYHTPCYWNLYDQILIRPELIDSFSHDNLKILNRIKDTSLLTSNDIINKNISDHLPIILTLNL